MKWTGSVLHSVKIVTNVRTITEVLNQSNIINGMLNEVDRLVQASLPFPVTSATVKGPFLHY